MKKYILFIFLTWLPYGLSAQSKGQSEIKDSFTDSRDGKTYKTVKIGYQVWMAENLNYDADIGSYCYDDTSTNCSKYGRLYTWEAAKRAAPPGWHLPTKGEFEQLLNDLGGKGNPAYQKLIQGGASKFDVLFGGWRNNYGNFSNIGSYVNFWSSTEYYTYDAWYLNVYSASQEAYVSKYGGSSGVDALSVRCVRD